MHTLPSELINIIGTNILKITDKRQFTQTSKAYNDLMKPIIKKQELKIKIKYSKYSINYSRKKFLFEIMNDNYINSNMTTYTSYYLAKDGNFFIFA